MRRADPAGHRMRSVRCAGMLATSWGARCSVFVGGDGDLAVGITTASERRDPFTAAADQAAGIVELNANAVAVQTRQAAPAGASGMPGFVIEWHQLGDAAITPDHQMSRDAGSRIAKPGYRTRRTTAGGVMQHQQAGRNHFTRMWAGGKHNWLPLSCARQW